MVVLLSLEFLLIKNYRWLYNLIKKETKKSYTEECEFDTECATGYICTIKDNYCNCPTSMTANHCDCPITKYNSTTGCGNISSMFSKILI